MRIDAHRCASAKIGAWPTLVMTIGTVLLHGTFGLETPKAILFNAVGPSA